MKKNTPILSNLKIHFVYFIIGIALCQSQQSKAQTKLLDDESVGVIKQLCAEQMECKPISACLVGPGFFASDISTELIYSSQEISSADKRYFRRQIKKNKDTCYAFDSSLLGRNRKFRDTSDHTYTEFTYPIFNANKTICIVGVVNFCKFRETNMSCGGGVVLVLQKKMGVWKDIEALRTWIDN